LLLLLLWLLLLLLLAKVLQPLRSEEAHRLSRQTVHLLAYAFHLHAISIQHVDT
jgi:hypothetical protein